MHMALTIHLPNGWTVQNYSHMYMAGHGPLLTMAGLEDLAANRFEKQAS
jgi:hypothetical protein